MSPRLKIVVSYELSPWPVTPGPEPCATFGVPRADPTASCLRSEGPACGAVARERRKKARARRRRRRHPLVGGSRSRGSSRSNSAGPASSRSRATRAEEGAAARRRRHDCAAGAAAAASQAAATSAAAGATAPRLRLLTRAPEYRRIRAAPHPRDAYGLGARRLRALDVTSSGLPSSRGPGSCDPRSRTRSSCAGSPRTWTVPRDTFVNVPSTAVLDQPDRPAHRRRAVLPFVRNFPFPLPHSFPSTAFGPFFFLSIAAARAPLQRRALRAARSDPSSPDR